MSKVIVVGCGHGGLMAAAKMAKGGLDVTVYESRQREQLGYEWEDRFDFDMVCDLLEMRIQDLPEGSWCYRGDTVFVSPQGRTRIPIRFGDDNRQKIMWRRPLMQLLLDYATRCGVSIHYGVTIRSAIVVDGRVVGVEGDCGRVTADLVVDACGVFSPLRMGLPASFGLEKQPKRGDLFYAYRAYYDRLDGYETPAEPFAIYLMHVGEQGLSWVCTNADSVDILLGRIDPLDEEHIRRLTDGLRKEYPWTGTHVVCGGTYGYIPVRRPLALMVAPGYACVGDSAYMTTPMNGMGIDLSLQAGALLARCVLQSGFDVATLWRYNTEYLRLYGADAAKNAGLKSALLAMPSEGVDFLFDSGVIAASDLSSGGKKMSLGTLLAKLAHGMRHPRYFFAVIRGLLKGAKATKLYKKAPATYDLGAIAAWSDKIAALDILPRPAQE